MQKLTRLFSLCAMSAALLGLVACTTTSSSTTKNAAARSKFLQAMQQSGVPSPTYQKISNARVLTFSDILGMVKSGTPGSQIVAYLQATRAPYNFSQNQIQQLVAAGADSTLTNYVGRSQGDFLIDAQNAAAQDQLVANAKIDKEFWSNPYFTDPFFDGDIPFEFGWPAFW